jgi:hypothetical protein
MDKLSSLSSEWRMAVTLQADSIDLAGDAQMPLLGRSLTMLGAATALVARECEVGDARSTAIEITSGGDEPRDKC